MVYTTFLSQVHDLASEIRRSLPPASNVSGPFAEVCYTADLQLKSPSHQELSTSLKDFQLPIECQRILISIYESKVSELSQLYRQVHQEAVSELQRHGDIEETYHQHFREFLANRYSQQAQRIWEVVTKEARLRSTTRRGPGSGEGTGIVDRFDSLEPYQEKSNRGHDSDAVRILEQAFNHSSNITQAEKFQLAEVTGLKPKQVTIWVSPIPFCKALRVSTSCRRVPPLDDDDQFPLCEQYCG